MAEELLAARSVSKRFGPTVAVDDVTLSISAREIHAVIGENGAGKSTLMHLFEGRWVPDSGEIRSAGRVAMVHQHFTLVPAFRVEENIALASLGPSLRSFDMDRASGPGLEAAQRLGWKLDAQARTEDLSVGMKQRIEIAKALSTQARAFLFDEPTAVLDKAETEELFRVLRGLRDQGAGVVLIAHNLAEVLSVADRITVLRGGKIVGSVERSEANLDQLERWMIGDRLAKAEALAPNLGAAVLEATDVTVRGARGEAAVQGVGFRLRQGEILGFGGVDGNGQVELAEALAGVRAIQSGTIDLFGGSRRPAYIPQDRRSEGLALGASVFDNLMIEGSRLPTLRRGPFVRIAAAREWAGSLIEEFSIKTPGLDAPAGSLSGGNQQKIVVARALHQTPDVLVAVNPTRGLDLRATEFVRSRIRSAAAKGAGVALFSSDRDELDELSHHVFRMSGGALVGAT
ncbi:MAG: ATP-binding cassette domain-containing protein [Armatimonadetes bacterium]|nr:ATP-binding cassette domain-containing protein [Armatimonadota bacterium]MCK6631917.1 ATP-binding cassette domain-containing protein [Fimbriimonadaceae bacterium]NOG39246.1 ATP-binding cassette domain-containing protein [Armatimonadota bacterium]NUM38579.1 ATP-binding cassette domain-containing protein [Armatimonadota bacterium]GIK33260.1 MAG: ABC transporter [Armatimonadota bacterium]